MDREAVEGPRSPARLYPFLLAVVPVLHLVASNPGWSRLGDLAVVLAVVLAGCGVVYGLAALLARGRWAGRLPPLAVLAAVLWFWGYVQVVDRVGHRGDLTTHLVLLPLGLAATLGLGWWLLHRPAGLDRLTSFLTLAGALLVGWSALSIGITEVRSALAIRRSPIVQRLGRPIRVRAGVTSGPKRDIYLIILDEYANAEVTRARYGFDNHVFLDSLRQLGFVVPAVHSNYLHTLLSLPSLLNASQLADLGRELGGRTSNPRLPNYLLEHNRVGGFLQSEGYTFAFFPSLWWPATRHNRTADWEFDGSPGFDPVRELSRTELRRDLRIASMLDLLHRESGWHAADADQIVHTFEALARVPGMPGPVFAFAHVLSPHQPFTFGSDCRPITGKPAESSRKVGGRYVAQIECLDQMVLKLVTSLLHDSDVPPVILLQGDHGVGSPPFDSAATAEEIPLAAAHDRFGAFGAYYLPNHGAAAFGDSVTVVNVMGNVLRQYLGADLPREPDDLYVSSYFAPYAFKRVNLTWLAQADSLAGRPPGPGAATAALR
ncbi:MAG: sulfatase-like hydrolase/transferase [Gemmatimonadales bacterium]